MSHTVNDELDAFKARFNGQVLTVGHTDYDRMRAVWNGAIDRSSATRPGETDSLRDLFSRGATRNDCDSRSQSGAGGTTMPGMRSATPG